MKNQKEYDYYIFVDYSESLIGYSIIQQKRIGELLSKISRFEHYRNHRNKKVYIKHINNTIKRENVKDFFEKIKITKSEENIFLFTEVLEFVKFHNNCVIFLSIDDYQFKKFKRLLSLIDRGYVDIRKESQLKKGTPEYQVSLVIDNLLNIERRKSK